MTINERIRHFRKDILHLNQRQFASELGMAQTGISGMEQENATVTERTIKAICFMYHLNENWLRYGEDPMYVQPSDFSLDEFVKAHNGTEFEIEIMKAYFDLDQNIREKLINHFQTYFTGNREKNVINPMSVEEAEVEYIKSRLPSAPKKASYALNITDDKNPKAVNK